MRPSNALMAFFLGSSLGCASTPLPRATGVTPSSEVENGKISLGNMRFNADSCKGFDLTPERETLDQTALVEFLKARKLPTRTERARGDLIYVDVQVDPEKDLWGRLRVAILPSREEAGNELFEAVLEHGTGSWGVHRNNLAILAPIGRNEDIVAFFAKTKLQCWGVATVAKRKRVYVIPGGYREL